MYVKGRRNVKAPTTSDPLDYPITEEKVRMEEYYLTYQREEYKEEGSIVGF